MSTQQHPNDSSLNNQPERDARKLISGISGGSTGIIGSDQGKERSIIADTDKDNAQEKTPINKHGDTWGGGISGHNTEFK